MGDFLCVVSAGRSGSTLLQRLLNTHPGVVLFGEHGGFLAGLRAAHARLGTPRTGALIETGRRYLPAILGAEPTTETPGGWSTEWTNALRPADAGPAFARLVEDLLYPPAVRSPAHRYWGFKEIRYGAAEVAFLATIFPGARFVFLARDPVAAYRSQCRLGWRHDAGPERAAADFHRTFNSVADAWEAVRGSPGDEGPDRARLVCYERLVAEPVAHLRLLSGWLGLAPFDEDKALAVAGGRLTPQLAHWSPRAQAFLSAYERGYADRDRRRHAAITRDAAAPAPGAARPGGPGPSPGRRPGHRPAPVPHVCDGGPAGPIRATSDRIPGTGGLGAGAPRRPDGPGPIGSRPARRRLVFLHLQPAGVAALHRQIAAAFGPGEVCPHRHGLPAECRAGELEGYWFYSGRFSFDDVRRIPGEVHLLTLLRSAGDPLWVLREAASLRDVATTVSACARARDVPPAHEPRAACGARTTAMAAAGGALTRQIARAAEGALARRLAQAIEPRAHRTSPGGTSPGARTQADVVRLALSALDRLDTVGFADQLDLTYAALAHEVGLPQAPRSLVQGCVDPHDWPPSDDMEVETLAGE